MNSNEKTTTQVHHYMMQPGDGTVYRFGWSNYPIGKIAIPMDDHLFEIDKSYIMDSGVGDGKSYVWFYINMAYQSAVGCIMKDTLLRFGVNPIDERHAIGYLKGHKLGEINTYTLVAVLLGLGIAIAHSEDLDLIERNMLRARKTVDWLYDNDYFVEE